jgi:pyridinium-3,5-biscarboxylic acid mononucleotide sulfurtransferase
MNQDLARNKRQVLVRNLKGLGSVLVAFSGGMDSAFLLALAREALGEDVLAVTAHSPIHPPREWKEARAFASELGVPHLVVQSDEMALPEFVSNPVDRCYHCKRRLLEILFRLASEKGMAHVAHGANLDDVDDFRPGSRAAEERGVIAPLLEARLTKEEIRFLSREMNLSTSEKPPNPCLATRIPYGTPITADRLKMVLESEEFLLGLGLKQVRVRHHGILSRIELDEEDMGKFLEGGLKQAVVQKLREIGFAHVALDLEGYKQGKLNRGMGEEKTDGF